MSVDSLEPSNDSGCEVAIGRPRIDWGFFIGCLGVLTIARRRRSAATVVIAATLS